MLPEGIVSFNTEMSSYVRANVRLTSKRTISSRTSRGLKWENKTYKLKRSIGDNLSNNLQKPHNRAARVITGAPYSKLSREIF